MERIWFFFIEFSAICPIRDQKNGQPIGEGWVSVEWEKHTAFLEDRVPVPLSPLLLVVDAYKVTEERFLTSIRTK